MGVRLFIGGQSGTVQGERDDLTGDRCFTAAHQPKNARGSFTDPQQVCALLDSGAFTDPPAHRLTPELALQRQLRWELRASQRWQCDWRAYGLVSYDRLIDEVWVNGERRKRRWTLKEADLAVRETIDAAAFLTSQRAQLAPRKLFLACQGVDAIQYEECIVEVLKYAVSDDVVGMGGWCILGRWKSWLPEFWATIHRILPRIAAAGIKHIHIFGVLWLVPLGGLLYLADRYGLSLSTDSSTPILACTRKDMKKAGIRVSFQANSGASFWRENCAYWRTTLANLRTSHLYQLPAQVKVCRQEMLF